MSTFDNLDTESSEGVPSLSSSAPSPASLLGADEDEGDVVLVVVGAVSSLSLRPPLISDDSGVWNSVLVRLFDISEGKC